MTEHPVCGYASAVILIGIYCVVQGKFTTNGIGLVGGFWVGLDGAMLVVIIRGLDVKVQPGKLSGKV